MIQQASRNISHTPGQNISGVEMDVFLKQMMSKKR
jgi:hypothetical protein